MKLTFTLSLILVMFSSVSFAKDYKLTKDEFLKKIDEGRVTLEKTPIANVPENIRPQLVASQKKQFPQFEEEMWYVGYVQSDNFRYFVFYEWYNRGCIFGISEPSKYGKDNQQNWTQAAKEMQSYEPIDKKYCEKYLGIDLPDGSLKGSSQLYNFKKEKEGDKK